MKDLFIKNHPAISFRSFVTFLLTFSLLLMVLSSLVLFVLPHGRISYWNDFRIWGMGKDQWNAVHVIGGFVLILSGFFHLYFNWNVLMSYLKKRKASLLLAFLAALVFLSGSALEIPPFSSIMALSESAKGGWSVEPPPAPHYEYRSLREICDEENMPFEIMAEKLHRAGIERFEADESLKTVAERHGLSPAELYRLMEGKHTHKPGRKRNRGGGSHSRPPR